MISGEKKERGERSVHAPRDPNTAEMQPEGCLATCCPPQQRRAQAHTPLIPAAKRQTTPGGPGLRKVLLPAGTGPSLHDIVKFRPQKNTVPAKHAVSLPGGREHMSPLAGSDQRVAEGPLLHAPAEMSSPLFILTAPRL